MIKEMIGVWGFNGMSMYILVLYNVSMYTIQHFMNFSNFYKFTSEMTKEKKCGCLILLWAHGESKLFPAKDD